MRDPAAPARVRVALRTLGCKVNRTESDALAEELEAAGAVLVDEADADVVVVNSCTVTGEADAKTRKAVRQALGQPHGPIVVVTGCMAALDAPGLSALGPRVVVAAEKGSVAANILGAVRREGEGVRRSDSPRRVDPRLAESPPACGTRGGPPRPPAAPRASRTRVAVKVQDGCDDRCSYCIVPDARGSARSLAAEEIVGRVAALVAGGTAEVVLTGINVGRYRDGGTDLAALVRRLAVTGIARIRISSIEPQDVTDALLAAMAELACVMPHLHVPLQSGCDRTLAAMGRRYDTDAFAATLAAARAAVPGLAVTTDVIVGFPGETGEDHAASLAFVEACGFTKLHVFRYSPRPGTPAAALAGRVDPRVAAVRASEMRALGERLARAHARARVGGEAAVLVERVRDGAAVGTSEDYLRVRVPRAGARRGEILRVRLVTPGVDAVSAEPL